MANRSFHHVLIVDADDGVRGVISDRDVLRALSRTPKWHKKSVSAIMTKESVTTTPDCLISVAAHEMLAKRINCLPVIDAEGRVGGILTSSDLLKAYATVQALVERFHSISESPSCGEETAIQSPLVSKDSDISSRLPRSSPI